MHVYNRHNIKHSHLLVSTSELATACLVDCYYKLIAIKSPTAPYYIHRYYMYTIQYKMALTTTCNIKETTQCHVKCAE